MKYKNDCVTGFIFNSTKDRDKQFFIIKGLKFNRTYFIGYSITGNYFAEINPSSKWKYLDNVNKHLREFEIIDLHG